MVNYFPELPISGMNELEIFFLNDGDLQCQICDLRMISLLKEHHFSRFHMFNSLRLNKTMSNLGRSGPLKPSKSLFMAYT